MALRDSSTYKFVSSVLLRVRTWSRRTIWGDRLFLRFEGPSTILIQSRASRVRDVLTRDEVNEIADAPAGVVTDTIRNLSGGTGAQKIETQRMGVEGATPSASPASTPRNQPKLSVASVSSDGKVTFEAKKDP